MEWLKKILGDSFNEDIGKKVTAEIEKAYVTKADFDTLDNAKKNLEAQIGDRDKQLEDLKKLKPDELLAQITQLQSDNADAKQKFDADLKAVKLDYALESLLVKEGAVNTKAVRALLDSSKISLDGDNLIGVDEQLKALKESEKWAFTSAVPPVPGGGNPPPASGADKTPLPSGTVTF